jgi:hypothetical protein
MKERQRNAFTSSPPISVSGRVFDATEIELVRTLTDRFPALSRNELALTVCELIDWKRPSGRPKSRECLDLFERLEDLDICRLPPRRRTRPPGTRTTISGPTRDQRGQEIQGDLKDLAPVTLEPVSSPEKHRVWRELIGRFHYLGFATAFGASMRFLILDRDERCLGCLQYSSPAWRMQVRDRWIGWSDLQRRHNLQRVVNQSRFLILPWVRVPNLGSHVLAKSARQLPDLWQSKYGVTPVLIETLVDRNRYTGTCYLAANWVCVGDTSGRGRMDREHRRHGMEIKRLFLIPLARDFRRKLLQQDPAPQQLEVGFGPAERLRESQQPESGRRRKRRPIAGE